MRPARRAAAAIALTAGVAAGAGAWARLAPLPSFPEVVVRPAGPRAWDVRVVARGDEPLADVQVACDRPGLRFEGPTAATGLARGASLRVRAVLEAAGDGAPVLRVTVGGPSGRTMDVPLLPFREDG